MTFSHTRLQIYNVTMRARERSARTRAVINAIGECGKSLSASQRECTDATYTRVCTMSRDVSDARATKRAQASSGRDRPLCRQRHLSNMF